MDSTTKSFDVAKLARLIENSNNESVFTISAMNGNPTMLEKTVIVSGVDLCALLEKLKSRQVYYCLTGKVINDRFDGVLEMRARTPEQLGAFL